MKNITQNNQLMQDAIRLTSEMKACYPDLYKFLDETPLYLSRRFADEISKEDIENHIETLKDQMQSAE